MIKRLCALLICLLLSMSVLPPAMAYTPESLTWDGKPATLQQIATATGLKFAGAGGSYTPIYADAANDLWYRGLFLGSDGSFRLDEPMRRVEGAVMIVRLLGKETEALSEKLAHPFTDVPEWADAYVGYVFENGITKGTSDTLFGSDDAMTANQFITFALRVLGYQDGVDFSWDSAASTALDIGLVDASSREQYMRSNLFMRDSAAKISRTALDLVPKDGGGKLITLIDLPSPNTGTPPSATAGKPDLKVDIKLVNVITGTTRAVYYSVTAGSSGSAEFKFYGNGRLLGSKTFDVKMGTSYLLVINLFVGANDQSAGPLSAWTMKITVNDKNEFEFLGIPMYQADGLQFIELTPLESPLVMP